jgi:alkanesulfonate monooxygenase SsuD/methylene tetrahydromethanopterin reductase-like flavin-dependent oxidoreductase (luciferase family)
MPEIHFGFILPQAPPDIGRRGTFVEDVNRALRLISDRFDSARIIDHLGSNIGDIESFTTLAYFAALHPQLKFGHTVICQSFRNPALVAKMGATLQLLSGGRFLLGMGTGWFEEEYKAYGYDFPPARVRVEQLEEALQIIKALWTEKKVTFSGMHYRVFEADCEPKPVPLPPIMVGAFRPKMLHITSKYADEWNVSSTGIQKYRRLAEAFEGACADVGRNPDSVRRSWGGGCICRHDQVEAERIAGRRYNSDPEEDFDFVGTPRQIIEQMRPFIDLGVSSFIVDCGGFPNLTTLELLINEVLPVLNHAEEQKHEKKGNS